MSNALIPFATAAALLAAPVLAGDWRILTVNGIDVLGAPELLIEADGRINGNTGCNSFQGAGHFEAGELVVSGPMAVTQMACPGDGLDQQEATILSVLQGASILAHDPFSGTFTLIKENDTLELVEQAPSVFEAGYVTVDGLSGPLNVRQAAGTDAEVVASVLVGTLLRNEGCRAGDQYDWCNVSFLDSSGTSGWVASAYLQAAPATVRAQQGLFDNIGTLSCRVVADREDDLCDFGIARDGDHSAVLVVYRPDGSERVLHFADGALAYVEIEDGEAGNFAQDLVTNGSISITYGDEYLEVPPGILRDPAQ